MTGLKNLRLCIALIDRVLKKVVKVGVMKEKPKIAIWLTAVGLLLVLILIIAGFTYWRANPEVLNISENGPILNLDILE